MRCPRCGFQQAESAECKQCGKSLRSAAPRRTEAPTKESSSAPSVRCLSGKHALDLCQSLGNLLGAGNSLNEAIDVLSKSAQPRTGHVLTHVRGQVASGTPMWKACGPALPAETLPVLRLYEQRGDLATGFRVAVVLLERRNMVRSKVVKSMMMPLFIVGMVILMSPLSTLFLESSKAYISEVMPWMLGFLVLLAVLFYGVPFLLRATVLGDVCRRWAWRLPWPATLYVHGLRTLFCRIAVLNVQAGMASDEAFQTAALALPDPRPADRLGSTKKDGDVVVALAAVDIIDAADCMVLSSAVNADAHAGVEALERLVSRYQETFESRLKGLLRVLSILVTVGAIVWTGLQMIEGYTKAIDAIGNNPAMRQIQDLEKTLGGDGLKIDGQGNGSLPPVFQEFLESPALKEVLKEVK